MMWKHRSQGIFRPVTLLVLLVAIFGSSVCASHDQEETEHAYLEFLERTSNYRIMHRCDDCNSDAIDLSSNPVPFGEHYHQVAHVATNGLVSFGNVFTSYRPVPFSNESSLNSFIAAPYWADIDNSVNGEIWYEIHTAGSGENSTESNVLLEEVSQFVREQQDLPSFNGSWMLVATWNESFPFGISSSNVSEHNTFQAIVITNGTKTYAVFTYHCDDIGWANGNNTVIGFNAGGTSYDNHPFSGTPAAIDIDCENYPQSLWNNVVYDVNPLGSNSSTAPPLGGSCVNAGYTECCTDTFCQAFPSHNCYCDRNCHALGDCCFDIDEICPGPTILQPVGNETFLVVASALSVLHISLDGSIYGNIVNQNSIFTLYLAVDYDYRQNYVYFSNIFTGEISRTNFNGSGTEVLFDSSSRYIEDLAVDWITNNLYWTDTLNRKLEVFDLVSTYKTELLQTGLHSAPRAIVVDPNTRYMYWSDWGEPAKIERASMDGNNREVLYNTGLTWPNGLAIDYPLQRLYWADAFHDRIEYSSVDGTGREILLTIASGLSHPFGITVSGDQIYWTDSTNNTVYTAHKLAAISILPVFDDFLLPPRGIEAVDPNRQSTDITNYCEDNPCSHLCLLSASSPTNYTCACPEGSSLMADGTNCTEVTNVTRAPTPRGSCAAAGYTDCCNGGYCAGYPASCFCEPDCETLGDCCDDFRSICLRPTTEPTSTMALTSPLQTTTTPIDSTTFTFTSTDAPESSTTFEPGTESSTEQVYLEFLERTSNYLVMRRCDDCNSDAIDLSSNPVPFGEYYHQVAHVATNGLVSFGNVFTSFRPVPFSNESTPAVAALFVAAPYWADIDNSDNGEIWYEIHTPGSRENSTESNALLEEVSQFIRERQDLPSFNGSWMLVATWNESFPFSVSSNNVSEHNTFQAIVITNGTKTYAVFTYHCDDIGWANGNNTVIGFNAGGTSYDNHPFSGTPAASNIDCESYPQSLWNNIVYDVNPLGSNSTNTPPTGGSCLAAGYTECCNDLLCVGYPSFDCLCDSGCHRFGDCCRDINQTCSMVTPQGNETFLIIATSFSVIRMNIDGTAVELSIPFDFSSRYLGIDYHYRQQYMYMSNLPARRIERLGFSGTSPETVVNTTLQSVEDLAVDWIANNLYWTDTLGRKLEVFNLDSKHRTELLRSDAHSAPKAIVVDPSTRYMYWSDWGEPAKIERASMDGSDRKVLHNTGLTWPNGLAIDYQLQRLYWADAFHDRIEYSSVDGTGREILLTVATGLHHPFAITISGDQVYWTDWSNFTVYTAHKQAAISILPVYIFFSPPNGIEAVDPNRQSTEITNYCEDSPCSHLCLLSVSSPTNYTCACPEGSSLVADGTNCTEVANVTTAPPQRGSCIAAGYTDFCCNGGYCAGSPPNCFCESDCINFLDCCDDFRAICAAPTTVPATTLIQPTSTTKTELPTVKTESPIAPDNYLEFLERTSNYLVMRRCDDCNSDAIDLSSNPVPFGEYYHQVAHVATNGLVSFGNVFTSFTPVPFSNESTPTIAAAFVAAPYWADIDNRVNGDIWYETHTAGSRESSNSLLEEVSQFIRAQEDLPSFNGSWMLVATWNESFPFGVSSNNVSEHNTFQAIVITNGTKTYTVFTYHCDDIGWANGNNTVIGFNAGGTSYDNHPFSGTPAAIDIDCENYPQSLWNNVVYDVNPLGSNSSSAPPLGGLCSEAGYTECCNGSGCLGAPTFDCYCDSTCHGFGDCCSDIDLVCPRSVVTGNETFLIVANSDTIYQISTNGSSSVPGPLLPFSTSSHYLAVEFDYRQQYVYYSDLFAGQIGRVGLNGSALETLFVVGDGLQFIEDLAVDWIANNLYWTDTLNRRLEVLDIDSRYSTELLQTGAHSAPKAIVVDPDTRYMYWSDWGEPAKIERASMDGSDRKVLHNTGLTWPNGLAIDYQLQRLYWVDAFHDRIEYSSVDGTGREILLTVATGLHHPFAITVSGDQVYWTDWSNLTVYTAHKQAAINILPVYDRFYLPPNGIEAIDPNRQSTEITNYCEDSPCSHLCLLSASSPKNYTCACPEGSSLMADGTSCTEVTNITIAPTQRGSCAAAGYTDCCAGGYCAGYPAGCFCEPDCERVGDCCDDFHTICPVVPPRSTPAITMVSPTATTEVKTPPTSATPTGSTEEPTDNTAVFSSSRVNGGVIAGALIMVIVVLVLIATIILGVLWIMKKKKLKDSQAYGLFENDAESDTSSTYGELRPRLNSYEQKEMLGKESVSYGAGSETVQFKFKPNAFVPLEPDDAV